MQKKTYQAPVVELMECKVEKGFAGSGNEGGQIQNLEMGNDVTYLFN